LAPSACLLPQPIARNWRRVRQVVKIQRGEDWDIAMTFPHTSATGFSIDKLKYY
jgi:hypothetical protein